MAFEGRKDYLIPATVSNPKLLILSGFLLGLVAWILDTEVDVLVFEPGEDFITNLLQPELNELWMRSANIFIMTLGGWIAIIVFSKTNHLNTLLYKYQNELEKLVDDRTRELQKKTEQLQNIANRDPLTNI